MNAIYYINNYYIFMNDTLSGIQELSTLLGWSQSIITEKVGESSNSNLDDFLLIYSSIKKTTVNEENINPQDDIIPQSNDSEYLRDHSSLFNILDKVKQPKIKFESKEPSDCFEFISINTDKVISHSINFSNDYIELFNSKANFAVENDPSDTQKILKQKIDQRMEQNKKKEEERKIKDERKEKHIEKQNKERYEKKEKQKIDKQNEKELQNSLYLKAGKDGKKAKKLAKSLKSKPNNQPQEEQDSDEEEESEYDEEEDVEIKDIIPDEDENKKSYYDNKNPQRANKSNYAYKDPYNQNQNFNEKPRNKTNKNPQNKGKTQVTGYDKYDNKNYYGQPQPYNPYNNYYDSYGNENMNNYQDYNYTSSYGGYPKKRKK